MTNYSNLAGKFISAHPVQTQTQTVIPNTNTKPKLHSSEPECNNFHKGSHVIRKGEICEVIKVDYTVDPPALLVRTPDGREVATEIHLVQLHNEEYRVNAFLRQLGARCTSNNAGDGPQNSHRDNDQHNQCGECGDSKRHPDLRTHTAIKEKNQHSPHWTISVLSWMHRRSPKRLSYFPPNNTTDFRKLSSKKTTLPRYDISFNMELKSAILNSRPLFLFENHQNCDLRFDIKSSKCFTICR